MNDVSFHFIFGVVVNMSSYSEYLGRQQQRLKKYVDTRPHRDAGHQTEVIKRLAASGVQDSKTPNRMGNIVLNGPSTQVKSFYAKAHTVQDTTTYNEYTAGQAVAQSEELINKKPSQIEAVCYSSTVVPEFNDKLAANSELAKIQAARNALHNCCKSCGKVVQASVCGCTNTVPEKNIAVVGFQGIII
jgi:hypothetical protein